MVEKTVNHGDPALMNALWDGEVVALLDFEFAVLGPVEIDLCRLDRLAIRVAVWLPAGSLLPSVALSHQHSDNDRDCRHQQDPQKNAPALLSHRPSVDEIIHRLHARGQGTLEGLLSTGAILNDSGVSVPGA